MIVYWLIFIILLVFSAFFSGSETALLSAPRYKVHSKRLKQLIKRPHTLIISLIIGNEFVNIAATTIFTTIFISYFGAGHSFYSIATMTVIVLIFGEITPKTIAYSNPLKFSAKIEPYFVRFVKFVTPLRKILEFVTKYLIYLLTGQRELEEKKIGENEFYAMIKSSRFGRMHKNLLIRSAVFSELKARDLMTPYNKFPYIFSDEPIEEIYSILKRANYIGIPVLSRKSNEIEGILSIKRFVLSGDMQRSLLKPVFIPESAHAMTILRDIDKFPQRLALVTDEYGAVAGVLTKEMLIESLIGNIYKKGFTIKPGMVKKDRQGFIIDAQIRLFQLEDILNIRLPSENKGETLNGFLVNSYGDLPAVGEKIRLNGFVFTVLTVKKHEIKTARLVIK